MLLANPQCVVIKDGDTVMVDGEETDKALSRCEQTIHDIRRDEFGVGVHLNEDGQRLMKVWLKG